MNSKPWYKSKTLWVGVLTVALAVVQYLTGILDTLMDGGTQALAVAALGVLTIILRAVTGQPLGNGRTPPAGLMVLAMALLMTGCATTADHQRTSAYLAAAERTACLTAILVCGQLEKPRDVCLRTAKEVCSVSPVLLRVWTDAARPVEK